MGYFDFYPYSQGRIIMTFVVGAGAAVFLVLLGLLHTERKLRCEWDYSRAKGASDTARVDAIVLHVGVTADSQHQVIPHTCREFRGPALPKADSAGRSPQRTSDTVVVTRPTIIVGRVGSSPAVRRTAPTYRLFFPAVHLDRDEQIESFDLLVPCGHIVAITDIPWDWNMDLVRAISEVEKLHASAGHGISYVRRMDPFNGGVHITPTDTSCFNVTATVTAVFDTERVITLRRPELQLRP